MAVNNRKDFAPQSLETGNTEDIPVTEAADSVVGELAVPIGMEILLFDVTNSGANAFDQFEIQRRSHAEAAWETLANSAVDYTTPLLTPLLEVLGEPVTLAAAAVVNVRVDVRGMEGIRILASGDGATTATFNYRFGE